jgi:hypothetical protein
MFSNSARTAPEGKLYEPRAQARRYMQQKKVQPLRWAWSHGNLKVGAKKVGKAWRGGPARVAGIDFFGILYRSSDRPRSPASSPDPKVRCVCGTIGRVACLRLPPSLQNPHNTLKTSPLHYIVLTTAQRALNCKKVARPLMGVKGVVWQSAWNTFAPGGGLCRKSQAMPESKNEPVGLLIEQGSCQIS